MQLLNKLALMIAATFLVPTLASGATTLKYIDHEPLGGMRTRFLNDVLFAAIEKESGGRIKIEPHWGGELGGGYGVFSLIGNGGAADMAVAVPEYAADELPLHQIFKSFPVGPTGNAQVEFFRRVYAEVPALPAELLRQNAVNLFFATGYPLAYFSRKPMKSLDELKGTKWRTASFWHQDFLRQAAATPVMLPWNDGLARAMRGGTLDGVMVNVDGGYMLSLHKAAPNVLLSKELWLGHLYLIVINKTTWDGLAQQDRDAVQRATTSAYQRLGAVMDRSFDAQVAALKQDGARVRVLDSAELAAWRSTTHYRELQAAWVKQQAARGNRDAAPTIDKVGTILDQSVRK